MILEPKIVHVVGFCEADHAANPQDIIESAKITHGIINNFSLGAPQILDDPRIKERKEELVTEAKYLLQELKNLATDKVKDPWIDPKTIARAIQKGLLDAPHLAGNPYAAGKVLTQIKDGACYAVDPQTGNPLSEKERISRIK